MAEQGYDEIEVEILDDGTVKFKTDEISGPNHLGAEQFLAEMTTALGGPHSRQKQGNQKQKQKQKLKA